MKRVMCLTLLSCTINAMAAVDEKPNAAALTERFDREKVPVWADGDVLTFPYQSS